jgi:hypothetical protein
MPLTLVPGSKLGPSAAPMTSGYPAYHLFLFFGSSCNVHIHIYIYIYTHTLMYKDIGNLVPLHPCILMPQATVSWGP